MFTSVLRPDPTCVAVFGRLLRSACLVAGVWLAATAPAGAQGRGAGHDALPDPGRLLLRTQAVGVAIYECRALSPAAGRHDWVFKAPEALLFNEHGAHVGTLYAGPTFQWADGSLVVGDWPAGGRPGAVVRSRRVSAAGMLAPVAAIATLEASAGGPPRMPCDAARVGQEARVAFSATYGFYGAR